jgi:hypothetical protein
MQAAALLLRGHAKVEFDFFEGSARRVEGIPLWALGYRGVNFQLFILAAAGLHCAQTNSACTIAALFAGALYWRLQGL